MWFPAAMKRMEQEAKAKQEAKIAAKKSAREEEATLSTRDAELAAWIEGAYLDENLQVQEGLQAAEAEANGLEAVEAAVDEGYEDEVTQLKKELCRQKDVHKDEVTQLKEQLCRQKYVRKDEVTQLKKELCRQKDVHKDEVTQLEEELCRQKDVHKDEVTQLKEQLCRQKYVHKGRLLRNERADALSKLQAEVRQMDQETQKEVNKWSEHQDEQGNRFFFNKQAKMALTAQENLALKEGSTFGRPRRGVEVQSRSWQRSNAFEQSTRVACAAPPAAPPVVQR